MIGAALLCSVVFVTEGPGHTGRASASTSCNSPGSSVPIILVHGMNSSPSDFTSHSMNGDEPLETALEKMPGVVVETPLFSYAPESLDWVTNPSIGQALANYVTCVAAASKAAGGPGRVILITHSMGGLAAREALSLSNQASSDVGLIITVAAPNSGSWIDGVFHSVRGGGFGSQAALTAWLVQGVCGLTGDGDRPGPCGLVQGATSQAGTAMVPGSAQLADLPPPPSSIPLDEVAGDMSVTTQLFFGPTITLLPHGSLGDLLVKPDSALFYAGRSGVNMYTDSCSLSIRQLWGSGGWDGCAHGGLLYSQPVIQVVAGWITRYLTPPVLGGQPWPLGTQAGYGQVQPRRVDNGGDPTGVVSDISWSSWGGSTAEGVGVSDYQAGTESVAGGLQAPATIVAFNLGSCGGKSAYTAVEWYFPEYGQTFDPNNYIDACNGTYVDKAPPPPTRSVPGLWSNQSIAITVDSLGAVKVGMTVHQAEIASGFLFDDGGDGFEYPTTLPTGFPHLYAGFGPNGQAVCIGAAGSGEHQTVTTPNGFRLGGSLKSLKAIYGTQLHFVPAPPTGGLTDDSGYVVHTSAGNLVFLTDSTGSTIDQIIGGPRVGPNGCNG